MDNTPTPLRFWHGGQRWTGTPELRPSRAKSYECGPGIYLTTRLATARKYAKGAGQTVLMELSPDITLLEDTSLSLDELLEGLAQLPRVRGRKDIEQRLRENAQRHPDGQLPAIYLLNLCVNNDALGGDTGPALARWFTSKGIDASLNSKSNEDWLVVFNPAKIQKASVLKGEAPWDIGDLPLFKEQVASAPSTSPAPRKPRMG